MNRISNTLRIFVLLTFSILLISGCEVIKERIGLLGSIQKAGGLKVKMFLKPQQPIESKDVIVSFAISDEKTGAPVDGLYTEINFLKPSMTAGEDLHPPVYHQKGGKYFTTVNFQVSGKWLAELILDKDGKKLTFKFFIMVNSF